jgi:hypothetical protein
VTSAVDIKTLCKTIKRYANEGLYLYNTKHKCFKIKNAETYVDDGVLLFVGSYCSDTDNKEVYYLKRRHNLSSTELKNRIKNFSKND